MIPWLWAKTPVDFARQPRRFQRTIVRLMLDMVPCDSEDHHAPKQKARPHE